METTNAFDDLRFLKLKVENLIDFNCSSYSDAFFKRRLQVRMRALEIPDFITYIDYLWKHTEEREKLYKELTINVTNFFRDLDMWKTFMDDVIPKFIAEKKAKRNRMIYIWSAGCSSGEEAISILICFKEYLGEIFNQYQFKILATDIDSEIIKKAEEGVYDLIQFKEMDLFDITFKEKYFDPVNASRDKFKVKKEVFAFISYQVFNILSYPKPKSNDIIFCRNTVIYFNINAKNQLYKDFYNSLNENGFFIMGKTESLLGSSKELFKNFNIKERIYTK